MRCEVTWSSKDLHGDRARLRGIRDGIAYVMLDGSTDETALPIEAIDWAGARCAPDLSEVDS